MGAIFTDDTAVVEPVLFCLMIVLRKYRVHYHYVDIMLKDAKTRDFGKLLTAYMNYRVWKDCSHREALKTAIKAMAPRIRPASQTRHKWLMCDSLGTALNF